MTGGVDLSVLSVLVISANAEERQMVRDAAARQGHVVELADSAERAMAACQAGSFDVIVIDLSLPGISGAQWIRWYRAQAESGALLIAAGDPKADFSALLALGADDVLLLPITEEELVARFAVVERRAIQSRREHCGGFGTGDPGAMLESARFEGAFRQQTDSLVIVSAEEGRILDANPAAERLLGYGPGRLADRYFSLLVPDLFQQKGFESGRLTSGASAFAESLPYQGPDGRRSWLDAAGSGLQWGGSAAMLIRLMDATRRREQEEDRIQAAKAETIGALARGVSDEFNNILTGISGNIALMGKQPFVSPRGAELLADAEACCARARDLTRALAAFAEHAVPRLADVDLRPTLEKAVQFSLLKTKTRPHFHVPADLWCVRADESQFAAAARALTTNAAEAMESGGGGRLEIICANVEVPPGGRLPLEPGRYVRIAFRDEGEGIPAANLRRIFDPYFTTRTKSRGLGLPTAARFAQAHAGCLRAEAGAGGGAIFHLYLPAAKSPPRPANADIGGGEGDDATQPAARVLFMDDEEMVRTVVEKILGAHGFDVYTAKDGEEAVAVFRRSHEFGSPFDVLLFDLDVRGGMGGIEAIQEIRREHPSARAIICTGYIDDEVLANYRDYGFSGVITKPFEIEKLVSLVSQLAGLPRHL